jgi:hypothetical protein
LNRKPEFVFLALDYERFLVDTVQAVSTQVAAISKITKYSYTTLHTQNEFAQTLMAEGNRYLYRMTPRRFFFQGLGEEGWDAHRTQHIGAANAALHAVGVGKFSRMGFSKSFYLDFEMTRSELNKRFYGTFMADKKDLGDAFGQPFDALAHIFSEYPNGYKAVSQFLLQNEEEARSNFQNTPNLDAFRKTDRRFMDPYEDRIGRDSLFVQVDVFKEKGKPEDLERFLDQASSKISAIVERTIQLIHAL